MSQEVSMQHDQRFRALIEHSADALALLTPDGIIAFASPSSERVTGYPAEVLVGMNGFALLHPEDLENVRQQLTMLLDRPGHFITVEYRICHKNGTWRWIERNCNQPPS
jgi:PAS domain S-box-containing protein